MRTRQQNILYLKPVNNTRGNTMAECGVMLACFIDISIPVFHVILIECYHDTD